MSTVETLRTDHHAWRRDRRTWFAYATLTIFGFMQSVLGSVMPFLRDELHYSRTEIGWHFTAYAVGLVASGLAATPLLARLPTLLLMRVAVTVMVAVVVATAFVSGLWSSLCVAFAMGLSGGILQATVQAELAWHHGPHQGVALTEAFVLAGLGVFAGPLLFGGVAAAGIGWRWGFGAPAAALLLLLAAFRSVRGDAGRPAASSTPAGARGVPLGVLLCWLMVLLGIAAEWGVAFWGAQFLEERMSVPPATAVTWMSVFFGGTVFGRLVSSRLLRLVDGSTMLIIVIVLGELSLLGLRLFASEAAVFVSLAVAGMCLGNFFPLILSAAIRLAPDRVGLISTGATQAVGLALLVVPIALGYLADDVGLVDSVGTLAIVPLAMMGVYIGALRVPRSGGADALTVARQP